MSFHTSDSKYRYVLYSLPGIGIGVRVYDSFGNQIDEKVEETKEEAITWAEGVAADLGESISEAFVAFGSGLLEFVEGLMIAILKAIENAYDYIIERLAPYRVDTVKVVTMVLIFSLTVMVIMNMLSGAVAPIAN